MTDGLKDYHAQQTTTRGEDDTFHFSRVEYRINYVLWKLFDKGERQHGKKFAEKILKKRQQALFLKPNNGGDRNGLRRYKVSHVCTSVFVWLSVPICTIYIF